LPFCLTACPPPPARSSWLAMILFVADDNQIQVLIVNVLTWQPYCQLAADREQQHVCDKESTNAKPSKGE
jgi:hypothetical protein